MVKEAVFLGFGFVFAQLQAFQACTFAQASPKPKNPRSASVTVFLQTLWWAGNPGLFRPISFWQNCVKLVPW